MWRCSAEKCRASAPPLPWMASRSSFSQNIYPFPNKASDECLLLLLERSGATHSIIRANNSLASRFYREMTSPLVVVQGHELDFQGVSLCSERLRHRLAQGEGRETRNAKASLVGSFG